MKRTFYIDVDQTISTGKVSDTLQESIVYYRERGIAVPDEIDRWPDLFQVPEVVAIHEVLPGNPQEGLRSLLELGDVAYLTARKSNVWEITRHWLREHDFPCSDRVYFVEGVPEKLLFLTLQPGELVLIDDRWHQMLPFLEKYPHKLQGLYDGRLTLVAFGTSSVPDAPIVPVVPLLSWDHIGKTREVFNDNIDESRTESRTESRPSIV